MGVGFGKDSTTPLLRCDTNLSEGPLWFTSYEEYGVCSGSRLRGVPCDPGKKVHVYGILIDAWTLTQTKCNIYLNYINSDNTVSSKLITNMLIPGHFEIVESSPMCTGYPRNGSINTEISISDSRNTGSILANGMTDSDVNYVYISGGTYADRIYIREKTTFDAVAEFGSTGSGDSEFSNPFGVAVSDDYIFVSDKGNKRIVIYDKTTRTYVDKIVDTDPGMIAGQFEPNGMRYYDGYLYVCNSLRYTVDKIDVATKTVVSTFGSYGTANGQFVYPIDLDICEDRILVIDNSTNRITILFRSTFAYYGVRDLGYYAGINNPYSIIVSGWSFYIGDSTSSKICGGYVDEGLYPYAMYGHGSSGTGLDQLGSLAYPLQADINGFFIYDPNNLRVVKSTLADYSYDTFGGTDCVWVCADERTNYTICNLLVGYEDIV